MATRKKKPTVKRKKATPKKKATQAKRPVKRAVKAKPEPRRAGTPRLPPMHASVSHPELDEADHEEIFETFKAFDRDGSGSIDRVELSRLLEALGQGVNDDELEIALSVIDANGSGRISWGEFKAWWSSR